MNKQRMKKCCMDRGNYPFVIPDNYGEGIRGKKYFTDVTRKPREVRLVITSYRGTLEEDNQKGTYKQSWQV